MASAIVVFLYSSTFISSASLRYWNGNNNGQLFYKKPMKIGGIGNKSIPSTLWDESALT